MFGEVRKVEKLKKRIHGLAILGQRMNLKALIESTTLKIQGGIASNLRGGIGWRM